jgi:hypothetical protein
MVWKGTKILPFLPLQYLLISSTHNKCHVCLSFSRVHSLYISPSQHITIILSSNVSSNMHACAATLPLTLEDDTLTKLFLLL